MFQKLPYGIIWNMTTYKPISEYSPRELTIILLSLIAAGTLIITLAAAPGLGMVIRLFAPRNSKERVRLRKKIYDLMRSGYIEKGTTRYTISEKGRHLLTEEEVWNLQPPKMKRWDGKWHMVLFDIPGKKERARQALRARLTDLGYKPYQNSVFAHKQNLRPLIEKFATFYGIRGNIRFVTATSIV
jgi:DNA-binding transcriptional regulator PaaX